MSEKPLGVVYPDAGSSYPDTLSPYPSAPLQTVAWTRVRRASVGDDDMIVLIDGQNPVAFVKVMASAPGVPCEAVTAAVLDTLDPKN